MKIKIISLGCRLNQSEIESVSTTLQNSGHEITTGDSADIYIINSCAVTARSERKTRQLIYQALAKTGASGREKIIVTGCAPEDISGDSRITYLSNDHKYMIPEIIDGMNPDESKMTASRFKFDAPVKCSTNRVNLKIQDGCDNFCSFCIIPYTRGVPQSKPSHAVIEEFKELLDNGYKEIILTGVNIGKYSDGKTGLAELAESILSLNGEFRLHLTSLDPDCAPEKLLDLFSEERMVKHLHLSLQSGSDTVLKRMNRPYNRDQYIAVSEYLKNADNDFNFTTDVIAGFPGESDSEFEDTLSLIRHVGFSHIHSFRYSIRSGTKAADMKNPVPEIVKTERSRRIIELFNEQKIDYYRKFSGRDGVLLSEKFSKGITTGFNEYYIPVEVHEKLERNSFYKIKTVYNESRNLLTGNLVYPGTLTV
jgi:threonylcarbamoyladenosine tRNA methylthiotransferase MtaB